MNYKSVIESMKRVSATATDEIFIEHDAWETIIYAMDDMMKKIEKLESSKGGMFVDKKTKDALITIVRHVLDSDKKTEDPAAERDALVKQYEDKIAAMEREQKKEIEKLFCERERQNKEYSDLMIVFEAESSKSIHYRNRSEQFEEENNDLKQENKKLQEQADMDKMQIALYDKENKELRKNYAILMEVIRKAFYESKRIPTVPEETVFARDEGRERFEAWMEFRNNGCVCGCKEERIIENRNS